MFTPICSWSQANDWYFPPDIKMDANGGGFSNFSWGTAITNCTTFKSQQGVLSTNSGGASYRAFNACSIYDFNGTNINPANWGADILFAVPGLCNQYWEVSWKYVWGPPHSLKLSIVKYNGENPEHLEYIEEEDITPDLVDIPEGTCGTTGSWDVAVSRLANDGSRTIYAVFGSGLVSWTIGASGSVSYNGLLATLPYAINHQVRMEVTSDGRHVLMNPCGYQGVMIYDLYPVHGAPNVRLIAVGKNIAGYEYVPASITGSNKRLYVSSHNTTSPFAGGITYYDFNTGSGPTVPFTYGSQQVFGFTEIELAKNGSLYFAFNPTFGSGNVSSAGDLYYFDPSLSSSASPTKAGSGGEVSTYYNWGYYIQRQIDGENYDVTDYAMPQPQFDINGKIQPNPFNVNDIWYCSNKLNLNTTITGYHTYYTVKVDTGTITTGMFGIKSFSQLGSSFPLLTINNSKIHDTLDLVAYMSRLGKYNGSIRVTVTAYGCNTDTNIQLFNVKNPISGLMLAVAANPCNNGKVNGIRVDQLPIADQVFTSTPCMNGWVGAQTGGVTNPAFAGTGTVTNVTQTIDDVDPNTGAFIANIGTLSSSNIPNSITYFSAIVYATNPGYFITNYMSAIYKTYRYTLAVTEDGCTATDTIYFRIARDANPSFLGPSSFGE